MSAPRKSAQNPGPSSEIPEKLYFKIGEVAELVGVQPHVLRYWEKEIPFIRPGKTASNQRRYRRRDVEIFREIRRLLHEERYTLAGARRRVMSGERGRDAQQPAGRDEQAPQAPQAPQARAGAGQAPRPDTAPSGPAGGSPAGDGADTRRQLDLGFAARNREERLERLRAGLRELIRMAGEEP